MDNVFNWQRFALLTRRHFNLYFRTYLTGGVVLAGVMLLFSGLVVLFPGEGAEVKKAVTATYMKIVPILLGGLIVMTGTILQPYQRRKEAAFNLLLPASAMEKYALAWLVSLVFYTIGTTAIFFVVLPLGTLLMELQGYTVIWQWDVYVDNPARIIKSGWVIAANYLFVHAFALFGSIVFRKLAMLKVALGTFTLYISFVLVLIITTMVGRPLLEIVNTSNSRSGIAEKTGWETGWLWFAALMLLATFLLWTAAYFKLKNKKV